MAAGGLLLLVLLHAVTTWVRARRMSALRISITAVTVLPFAVWYGRGESGKKLRSLSGGASVRKVSSLLETFAHAPTAYKLLRNSSL